MAGAVDIARGRQGEVLADVEVLVAKEQDSFGDQVALHDHQGELLAHLQGESARVRLCAPGSVPLVLTEDREAGIGHLPGPWR